MTSIFAQDRDSEFARMDALKAAIVKHFRTVDRFEANAENYAKALFAAVRERAAAEGQNPDIECGIVAPGEEAYDGAGDRWLVMWEAGPDQWGVNVSLSITMNIGLVEPYHSFDLTFYPGEDYV
ncbi:hypothetical protein [Erythrobacter phage vB_EliS-L02]|nr:hypothetical protein [Erythrobacter phage vB_EliS-L02]